MKIYKKENNIVVEIPCRSKRLNPYMPDADVGEYPTLTGIIDKDEFGNEELGFAKTIDRDYKNKCDDVTDILIRYWDGDKKDFIELCKKLEIAVYEYPTRGTCGKSVYGCHTIDKNGKPMCFECEQKVRKT